MSLKVCSLVILGVAAASSSKAHARLFPGAIPFSSAANQIDFAVGDFNKDGMSDIAVLSACGVGNVCPATITILLGSGDGSFRSGAALQGGLIGGAGAIAVGDFNGDGFLDIASITKENPGSAGGPGALSIFPGKGDGTFGVPVTTNIAASSMTTGDVNGDGRLDIALADFYGQDAIVLIGKGDGTFQAPLSYPVAGYPTQVVLGDFNGDGKPDLALADSIQAPEKSIGILLNNGDGTFQGETRINSGGETTVSLAVADFNHDGKTDLAAINVGFPGYHDSNLSILLGNGDGTFQQGPKYLHKQRPTSVTIGDLNGDGNSDLIVLCQGVYTFTGNGDATFAQAGYDAGVTPIKALAGRFAAARNPGVALLNNPRTLPGGAIALNHGDGSLALPLNPTVLATGPLMVAFGDVNGDGKQDLVSVIPVGPYCYIGVQFGDGQGHFRPVRTYATQIPSDSYLSLLLGDLNHDGHEDIVLIGDGVSPRWAANAVALLNQGNGSFGTPIVSDLGQVLVATFGSAVSADFDGDGKLDLAIVFLNNKSGPMFLARILWGNGDGSFRIGPDVLGRDQLGGIAVADLNHDGSLDLAITETGTGVDILLGQGNGKFKPPVSYPLPNHDIGNIALGDFNGDHAPDIAVNVIDSSEHQNVDVLLNHGDGTFGAAVQYFSSTVSPLFGPMAAVDLNGDGRTDIVFAGPHQIYNLMGNGDGTFGAHRVYPLNHEATSIAIQDVNGDGIPDMGVSMLFAPFYTLFLSQ